jgi:hypothetical protein
MNRFAGALPTRLGRKTFWIAVAVIVVMLACATAVLSGGGPYVYGVDGMPRPDGPQADGGINYDAVSRRDGTILITRNRVPWITLANSKSAFLLSDPNGSGHTIVKFEHASSGGHGAAVRVRAPAR